MEITTEVLVRDKSVSNISELESQNKSHALVESVETLRKSCGLRKFRIGDLRYQ